LFLGAPLPDGANTLRVTQEPAELTLYTEHEKLIVKLENIGPGLKPGDDKIYQNFKITVTAQELTPEPKFTNGELMHH